MQIVSANGFATGVRVFGLWSTRIDHENGNGKRNCD